jgi:hypothetical protein
LSLQVDPLVAACGSYHSKLTPCCNLCELSQHVNFLLHLVAAVAPEVNIFNADTLEVHGSSRHRLNRLKKDPLPHFVVLLLLKVS